MKLNKKGLKEILRPALIPMARVRARGLAAAGPVERLLGEALSGTLKNRTTPEEARAIASIESLRRRTLLSREELEVVDFGAGAQTDSLTQEEMRSGRKESRVIAEVCRSASKPRFWALFLFRMIRALRPVKCLELGTSLGFSASYQAAALQMNGSGELVSLEGDGSLAKIAAGNFIALGLDNARVVVGRFEDTLPAALEAMKPVDYVFIDGHHEEKATLNYFEILYPFLADGAVVVFDDISWTPGMKRAWNTIAADQRVSFCLDLHTIGVAVIGEEKAFRPRVDIFLL